MTRLSLITLLASALTTLVAGQEASQTALPDLSPPEPDCGGCYLVADVAGIVFGGVQTVTDHVITSVGHSPNGTNLTTVTITEHGTISSFASTTIGEGEFTYSQSATATGAPAVNFGSATTVVINGATLTSPTQYEVFTAYSVTSFSKGSGGSCVPVPGTAITPPNASKYVVTAEPDDAFLLGLQSSFIAGVGLTCSAAGGKVGSTIQSVVERTTTSLQTSGIIRPVPVAASTAASSTPASASASAAASSSVALSTGGTSVPSGGVGSSTAVQTTTVVFGNSTLGLPTGTGAFSYTGAPIATGAAATAGVAWAGAGVVAVGVAAVLL